MKKQYAAIIMVLVAMFAASIYSVYAKKNAPKVDTGCPKLSQASLDLDTKGCPTTFDAGTVEKRTNWELDKIALTESPLDATDGAEYGYEVKVTEEKTTRIMTITGQIVLTNSGGYSAYLENVVANLQNLQLDDKGREKFLTASSAIALRSIACTDARTCFGNFQNSKGAKLTLTDKFGNDVTALTNPPAPAPGLFPIPPTQTDNDGDGHIDEDCSEPKIDNDGDGKFDEDPIDDVDNDLDGLIDEDPSEQVDDDGDGLFGEDCVECDKAIKINFEAEFDLAGLNISPGDLIRLEILSTFGSAGARGKSPNTTSCTVDANCNGVIDEDDPDTCNVNESEKNNIRTIKQRGEQIVPPDTPVCQVVELTDPGTVSANPSCVSVNDTENEANTLITATGIPNTTNRFAVNGTVNCVNGECGTAIVDEATLECTDGSHLTNPEIITGSPAYASIDVICSEAQPPGEERYCTQTQGGWGSKCPHPGGKNPGCLRDYNFPTVFPGGLFIGEDVTCPVNYCGKSGTLDGGADLLYAATWTSSKAIEDYLPAGGTPLTLSADLTDAAKTSSGVLDAQLVAATLNVAFSDANILRPDGYVTKKGAGDLIYRPGCVHPALVGKSVREVIDITNAVVADDIYLPPPPPLPPGVGTSALNQALTLFNQSFVDCVPYPYNCFDPPTPK